MNPVYWERADGFEYAYKVMTKQVPQPVGQSWGSPELFDPDRYIQDNIILQARIDKLVDRVTIRRALPVSPTPTAAKSPTIPHNHE